MTDGLDLRVRFFEYFEEYSFEFIFSEFQETKVGNKKKITIKTNRFPSSRTGT